MTVATPRIVSVQLSGGAFDGAYVDVPLDENGQPPQYRWWENTTARDISVNPAYGPTARMVTHFYELDTIVDADGVRWLYRWTGDEISDAAA